MADFAERTSVTESGMASPGEVTWQRLSDEAAQDAFAKYGEDGYRAYVQDALKPAPGQPIILQAPASAPKRPFVVRYAGTDATDDGLPIPPRPSVPPPAPAAKPRITRTPPATLGQYHGITPAVPPSAPPDASPRIAQPARRLRPEMANRPTPPAPANSAADDTTAPNARPRQQSERLAQAEEELAALHAQRRAGYLGGLLVGNQILARIAHPIDHARARRQQRLSDQKRGEYQQAFDELLNSLNWSDTLLARERVAALERIENRIYELQVLGAMGARDLRGNPMPTPQQQRVINHIAERWMTHRRAYKIAMVALPAGAIGLALGVGGAVVAAPPLLAAGLYIGAASGGRWIGSRVADTVARYKIATGIGEVQLRQRARERVALYDNGNQRIVTPDSPEPDPDFISMIEAGTRREEKENARRRAWAGAIGGLVASGTFAAGRVVTQGIQAGIQQASLPKRPTASATHVPHATPTPTPSHTGTPTPPPGPGPGSNTPPPPPGLGTEYPWTAAQQWNAAHNQGTSPADIWHTLQDAAQKFNLQNGTDLQYVRHGTDFWLQNGPHVLTPSEQSVFDNFLWSMPAP